MKTLLLALLALGHVTRVPAATLTVFAASSLTDGLKEIAIAYEKTSGDKVVFNFAASGPLARQIEAGAPADVFCSADEVQMDSLDRKGLLAPGTRHDRLSNALALVVAREGGSPIDQPARLAESGVRRLALGEPRTVPAGTYAKEYLDRLGLWPKVAPKVIPCENVRAVLAAVESGNVDAGFVYATDVAVSARVKIGFRVPVAEGPKIRYPFAQVKEAKEPAAAARFLAFLGGPEAGAVFQKRGFGLVP